jgi:phytoene dehydrogenase-like protein
VTRRYDAAIIGGGHNGLVCAALLARAGRSVVVLERRSVVGGAAITEAIGPGFRAPTLSPTVSLLRPAVVRALELERHGLSIAALRSCWAPAPEGPGVCLWSDADRTHDEIARLNVRDADRYAELASALRRLAAVMAPVLDGPAPDPTSLRPTVLLQTAGWVHGLLRSGDLLPLTQLATRSVADWLDGWLESDVLKAPLVALGLLGSSLGPRTPGTALNLLHQSLGGLGPSTGGRCIAIGGTGAVSEAIAAAAREAGAEIRTGADVVRVRIEGDQATGVVLDGGEVVEAATVVSGCDPKHTLLELVEARHLPAAVLDRTRRWSQSGSVARINLALGRLPAFSGRAGTEHLAGDIVIAPPVAAIDEAYAQSRQGRWSQRPFLHVTIPSLTDPTLAPAGGHVMTVLAQYAPYALAGGAERWADEREPFADHVMGILEELAPGLGRSVVARQIVTPLDLERTYGLTGGHPFHGEMTVDQLLVRRPFAGSGRHGTPVPGLWMCSAGSHPGGGVMGAAGARCAERMIAVGAV